MTPAQWLIVLGGLYFVVAVLSLGWRVMPPETRPRRILAAVAGLVWLGVTKLNTGGNDHADPAAKAPAAEQGAN